MSAADWTPILRAIVDAAPPTGDAADDVEPLPMFLPTGSFLRALDPSILLVKGDRGAGKTALFNALAHGGVAALVGLARATSRAWPEAKRPGVWATVAVGQVDFPEQLVAGERLAGRTDRELQAFWLGLLVRSLREGEHLVGFGGQPWARLGGRCTVQERIDLTLAHLEEVLFALDELDARLHHEGRRLFVCYDQLDRLMPVFAHARDPVGALLAFWYGQQRRWRALSPKVFLRIDLFDDVQLAFPDASKFFAGHQTELEWDRMDAWRMWIKRLVNQPDRARNQEVRRWARETSPGLLFEQHETLGFIPMVQASPPPQLALFDRSAPQEQRRPGEEHLAPLIERLVGKHMGAGPRKGLSFAWVPAHVEDALGRLLPRSFLHTMREAGARALERWEATAPDKRAPHPMQPSDLVAGLEKASQLRLEDLCDEDPWIREIREPLSGMVVPATREEWLRRLDLVPRSGVADENHLRRYVPNGTSSADILETLGRRGIVERRSSDTFTVPELYRAALEVRRKGGPQRRELAEVNGPLLVADGE